MLLLRVSSKKQGRGHSLKEQQKLCEDLCESKGFEVVHISRLEKPSSAAGADTLNSILDGYFSGAEVVVTLSLDRLSREPHHLFPVYQTLKSLGMSLYVVDSQIDSETDEGWYMYFLRAFIASTEKRRIGERSAIAGKGRAQRGKFRGGPVPYAYRYNKDTGLLEVEPSEAEVVVSLFKTYRKVKSLAKTVKLVDWRDKDDNLKNTANLGVLLRNSRYCGMAEYGDVAMHRKEEEIVSPRLFASVQKILDSQYKKKKKKSDKISKEALGNLIGTYAIMGGFDKAELMQMYQMVKDKHTRANTEGAEPLSDAGENPGN